MGARLKYQWWSRNRGQAGKDWGGMGGGGGHCIHKSKSTIELHSKVTNVASQVMTFLGVCDQDFD